MAQSSITIQGLDQLQRRLDQLKDKDATRIMRRGLRAAGEQVKAAIVDLAPVRPDLPSGTALPPGALKFDIEIRARNRGVPPGAAVITVGPGKYTAHVARWVEFGHLLVDGRLVSKRHTAKNEQGKQVRPHPFLRPAFEMSQEAAAAAFVNSVKTDLDRLQRKGTIPPELALPEEPSQQIL